jgi:hypothetical protein
LLIALTVLRWGGDLLVASDPQPAHVEAAVVLQGSIAAEKARLAGAVHLLQHGVADRILLSVPKESYWGQSIPPIARAYLERNYGSDVAARVDFCETGEAVNSTVQEAQALDACIREHRWQSIVVVTSNYHTRRAGIIWRKITAHDANLHLTMEGVGDPEFQQPWWRQRQSAKTFVMEAAKLAWTVFGGS